MEKPKVALIAHDKKKIDLIMFVKENIEIFKLCELYATGTTGKFLREKLNLPVNAVHSGPLGGDIQIGSLLVEGKMDFVIFLRDPLTAQPHEPDISALLRVCDVLNIPLATNLATAEALVVEIKSILKSSEP
ncbi:MAG: methylglyoxal synthase [Kosmotoga sp.]|uniref:methylglyoxal synthase n=1 Tax=Kosmotoga sp. TaxID=1955248 RepID=UPI0025C02224|nr:methylglyoxal synthase [Kosmotoga sp.]MCD6159127.1 methylglyoxal synthase [Kosmotoga sp.]